MKKYNWIVTVLPSNRFYGIFKTPNDAAKFAVESFTELTVWYISPVEKP